MASEFGIGARLPRLEDARFLEGRGQFCADIDLAGDAARGVRAQPPRPCPHRRGAQAARLREARFSRRAICRRRPHAFDRQTARLQAVGLADPRRRQSAPRRRADRDGDRRHGGRSRRPRRAGRGGVRAAAAGGDDGGRAEEIAAVRSRRMGRQRPGRHQDRGRRPRRREGGGGPRDRAQLPHEPHASAAARRPRLRRVLRQPARRARRLCGASTAGAVADRLGASARASASGGCAWSCRTSARRSGSRPMSRAKPYASPGRRCSFAVRCAGFRTVTSR